MRRAIAAALVTAGVALLACDDSGSYILLAQQYEPTGDCDDDYSAIDVIEGDDPGALCSPVCLTKSGTYYVTTECPPYPPDFGQVGLDGAVDPTCQAALAAFARTDLCVDGGSPTNPIDASADASPDATPDATSD